MESKKSESKMKANMVTVMKGSINGVELSDLNTDEINEPSASKTYTLENIETCIKRIYLHQTIHNKIIFGVFWSVLVCLLYSLVYTSQGSYENYFTVSNIRNSMVDTKDYNSLDFSEVGNDEDFYDVHNSHPL